MRPMLPCGLPDERPKPLRFGREFLIELRDCLSLPDYQRETVDAIQSHFSDLIIYLSFVLAIDKRRAYYLNS